MELLLRSLIRAHGWGSSSLVIPEVMVIFCAGTSEAGVIFQQHQALTRERIAVVLNVRDHFQSLGRPWLRQPLTLSEFLENGVQQSDQ